MAAHQPPPNPPPNAPRNPPIGLLNLPREIRDMIYDHVSEHHSVSRVNYHLRPATGGGDAPIVESTTLEDEHGQLSIRILPEGYRPLINVNRQLRVECKERREFHQQNGTYVGTQCRQIHLQMSVPIRINRTLRIYCCSVPDQTEKLMEGAKRLSVTMDLQTDSALVNQDTESGFTESLALCLIGGLHNLVARIMPDLVAMCTPSESSSGTGRIWDNLRLRFNFPDWCSEMHERETRKTLLDHFFLIREFRQGDLGRAGCVSILIAVAGHKYETRIWADANGDVTAQDLGS